MMVEGSEGDGGGERGVFAQQVNANGKLGQVPSQLIENKSTNPFDFRIFNPYPNPFNSHTTIIYHILRGGYNINLSVYNILGKKVTTLVNSKHSAGIYSQVWDGRDDMNIQVTSGLYFFTFTASNSVGKIIYKNTQNITYLK